MGTQKRSTAASEAGTVSSLDTFPDTAQAKAAEQAARGKSKAGTGTKARPGKSVGTGSTSKAGAKDKEPTQAEVKDAFRRTTDSLTAAAQAFAKLGKQVAAVGEGLRPTEPALPQPRNWRGSDEFRHVRDGILDTLKKPGRNTDPLVLDKVDEYMDFWVQRRMLAEDVEIRGLMVTDDRGRLQENRSASLGVQVSKQMSAIASQLGLIAKAEPTRKAFDAPEEGDEEDDL